MNFKEDKICCRYNIVKYILCKNIVRYQNIYDIIVKKRSFKIMYYKNFYLILSLFICFFKQSSLSKYSNFEAFETIKTILQLKMFEYIFKLNVIFNFELKMKKQVQKIF